MISQTVRERAIHEWPKSVALVPMECEKTSREGFQRIRQIMEWWHQKRSQRNLGQHILEQKALLYRMVLLLICGHTHYSQQVVVI